MYMCWCFCVEDGFGLDALGVCDPGAAYADPAVHSQAPVDFYHNEFVSLDFEMKGTGGNVWNTEVKT